MPKVSIIIPVYGVEKYIERCARSLFGQSFDDIEFLFIDDCTPDKSMDTLRQVLDDYPERKPQVVVHRMEKNSGQAAVRTWGMQHATGDYVIHCDSDDWVEPDYCRALYETAEREIADVVICDYVTSDGQSVLKRTVCCSSTDKSQFINGMLFQSDPWSLCNKLFRRTACYRADLVFPSGNMGEDMLLVFQMVLNARTIGYVPQPLYNYFYNPASITKTPSASKMLDNFRQFKANTDILLEEMEKRGLKEEYSDGLLSLKWFVKKFMWNLTFDQSVRELWRTTYPELTSHLFKKELFTPKERIKYILTNVGLYPKRHYEKK